jgi:hypothetical protein
VDRAVEIVAIQAIDLARREMNPIEQSFVGDQRRTLIVPAVRGASFIVAALIAGSAWTRTR